MQMKTYKYNDKNKHFSVCQTFLSWDFLLAPAHILCWLQNISSFDVKSQQWIQERNDRDISRDSDMHLCNLVPCVRRKWLINRLGYQWCPPDIQPDSRKVVR